MHLRQLKGKKGFDNRKEKLFAYKSSSMLGEPTDRQIKMFTDIKVQINKKVIRLVLPPSLSASLSLIHNVFVD